jgi:HTH-type transcriptional regulator/antitoxin HigA
MKSEDGSAVIAFRMLKKEEKNQYAALAWTQQARRITRRKETGPIDINKLRQSLHIIRSMTTEKLDTFLPQLEELLSSCGVALVVLPHLKGSFLHGATFYDGKHIVLGLTLRGEDADRFWFSLFHEIAHIVCGHIDSKSELDGAQEREADEFAQNILVSQDKYQPFVKSGVFMKETIQSFADEIGVAPGIVVGRLQREKKVPYTHFNELKDKYTFL